MLASEALLNSPKGLYWSEISTNLLICDTGNNAIKRVSPGGSPTTTIAGSSSGFADGASGTLSGPHGISVEAGGSILVADYTNNAIRAIQRIVSQ